MAEVILAYANFSIPVMAADESAQAVGLTAQSSGDAPLQPSSDDGSAVSNWHITGDQADLARELFQAGASIAEVARGSGMAWATARQILQADVVASGRSLVTWNEMTDQQVCEAAHLRAEGWTYVAIGERFGVSRTAVARRVKTYAASHGPM